MAERISEYRITFLTTIAITLTFIALIFIGQSIWVSGYKQGIYKGAFEGSSKTLKMCQEGHPACWPKKPPEKLPEKPPVIQTQNEDVSWLTREFL